VVFGRVFWGGLWGGVGAGLFFFRCCGGVVWGPFSGVEGPGGVGVRLLLGGGGVSFRGGGRGGRVLFWLLMVGGFLVCLLFLSVGGGGVVGSGGGFFSLPQRGSVIAMQISQQSCAQGAQDKMTGFWSVLLGKESPKASLVEAHLMRGDRKTQGEKIYGD